MRSRPRPPALTGARLCWGGLWKTWERVYADELQAFQDPRGGFRKKWAHIHADRNPEHLRTRGEVSGNCGPASTLTGTPEQPQDLRGGFRKCGATSTLAGAPRPLRT